MKIVAIADIHGLHRQLAMPAGDILVAAGDICNRGTLDEVVDFALWLHQQPYKHKVVIAGNHDRIFEAENDLARTTLLASAPGTIYLQDTVITINDLRIYGTPWTPTFGNWFFMADRGPLIRDKWQTIPEGLDVLITHGPPATVLDAVQGLPLGCTDLFNRIMEVRPRYHIFGHIHEGYGTTIRKGMTFVNASICDHRYRAVNRPQVITVEQQ